MTHPGEERTVLDTLTVTKSVKVGFCPAWLLWYGEIKASNIGGLQKSLASLGPFFGYYHDSAESQGTICWRKATLQWRGRRPWKVYVVDIAVDVDEDQCR